MELRGKCNMPEQTVLVQFRRRRARHPIRIYPSSGNKMTDGSSICISDLIIPGLVTNGTAKICCLGLILALFYSTVVIKNDFG